MPSGGCRVPFGPVRGKVVAMRWGRVVLGVVLIGIGAIWTFQGYGSLRGSFMTGSPVWMWIGIGCLVAGVVVLVTSKSRRKALD
jgi:hypothetical protein